MEYTNLEGEIQLPTTIQSNGQVGILIQNEKVKLLGKQGNKIYAEFDDHMDFICNNKAFYLKKESSPLEVIKQALTFELEHSFFHPECDPNYNTLNWCLYHKYKHQYVIVEVEERNTFKTKIKVALAKIKLFIINTL